MLSAIFTAFWFFLPAAIGNAAPILSAKIKAFRVWDAPMDMGIEVNGKRLLGDHKTWRGLVTGMFVGAVVAVCQSIIYRNASAEFKDLLLYDPFDFSPGYTGLILAAGALLGDALKSFFKRRIDVQPGKSWIPFDQLDYIVGGIIASLFIVRFEWPIYFFIVVIWAVLHPISSLIGYKLGWKKDKF